jgi:hypothetical protein
MKAAEMEAKNMGRLATVVMIVGLLVCGALLGLMFAANEASKESHVKGGIMVDLSGNPTQTKPISSVVTLVDLPKLSTKQLDEVKFVSFAAYQTKNKDNQPISKETSLTEFGEINIRFNVEGYIKNCAGVTLKTAEGPLVVSNDGSPPQYNDYQVIVTDSTRRLSEENGNQARLYSSVGELLTHERRHGRHLQDASTTATATVAAQAENEQTQETTSDDEDSNSEASSSSADVVVKLSLTGYTTETFGTQERKATEDILRSICTDNPFVHGLEAKECEFALEVQNPQDGCSGECDIELVAIFTYANETLANDRLSGIKKILECKKQKKYGFKKKFKTIITNAPGGFGVVVQGSSVDIKNPGKLLARVQATLTVRGVDAAPKKTTTVRVRIKINDQYADEAYWGIDDEAKSTMVDRGNIYAIPEGFRGPLTSFKDPNTGVWEGVTDTTVLELTPGMHTFHLADSYGDGWTGNSYGPLSTGMWEVATLKPDGCISKLLNSQKNLNYPNQPESPIRQDDSNYVYPTDVSFVRYNGDPEPGRGTPVKIEVPEPGTSPDMLALIKGFCKATGVDSSKLTVTETSEPQLGQLVIKMDIHADSQSAAETAANMIASATAESIEASVATEGAIGVGVATKNAVVHLRNAQCTSGHTVHQAPDSINTWDQQVPPTVEQMRQHNDKAVRIKTEEFFGQTRKSGGDAVPAAGAEGTWSFDQIQTFSGAVRKSSDMDGKNTSNRRKDCPVYAILSGNTITPFYQGIDSPLSGNRFECNPIWEYNYSTTVPTISECTLQDTPTILPGCYFCKDDISGDIALHH